MTTQEMILDKNARIIMKTWSLRAFKRVFPSLFKVIITSMNDYARITNGK